MSLINRIRQNYCDETLVYIARETEHDSKGFYKFLIKYVFGSGWRAYILSRPECTAREANGSTLHMYGDRKSGLPFVCVTSKVSSKEKMKAVARLWAKRYQRYIATGKAFNEA